MNEKNMFLAFFGLLGTIGLFASLKQTQQQSGFKKWKNLYGVHYESSVQMQYREKIFQQNEKRIAQHNDDGQVGWQMGLNRFADMSSNQFNDIYLGLADNSHIVQDLIDDFVINIDWVNFGTSHLVKNQGECASCWAFAAVGAIEAVADDPSTEDLSQQQLVDCSYSYGNKGCNGGSIENALKFALGRGIVNQPDYPYIGKRSICSRDKGKFKVSSYIRLQTCREVARQLTKQVLAVSVDASNWQLYSSGIMKDCGKQLNHGVLLVGANQSYWKIKNSWSDDWGQEGFILLARGNTCGVCSKAFFVNR